MADMNFNTTPGRTVERKLLLLYLNTGTESAPVWSVIGKRVEDSSMEYDWGDESKKDILGETYTTMQRPTITQTFDPCELDAADVAQQKIWNMAVRDQDASALSSQDMLIVHTYAGTPNTAVFAERYNACAVKPSGLGGAGNVGMPIDVTFGGTRTVGAAAVANGTITFTASGDTSPAKMSITK